MLRAIGKHKTLVICLIFLLALVPRLWVALSCTDIPVNDAAGYDSLASNIIAGKGFSSEGKLTSWREPLYPFFLASVYYFGGHDYRAARVAQAVLGAISCVLVFFIAASLLENGIAVVSALITAFNPALIKLAGYLLSENLFIFLFLLIIFFLARQERRYHFRNLLYIGILSGLASLTRSTLVLFPLFIILFMKPAVAPTGGIKRYMLNACILFFACAFTILPWTIRNWRVHHKVIPVSCRVGDGFYLSYVLRDSKFFEFDSRDPVIQRARMIDSEYERSRFLLAETVKFIRENPRKLPRIEGLKMLYFWSAFDWEMLGYGVYNFMYCFMLPFFVLGIFSFLKRFGEILPFFLPVAYTLFVSLVTFGSPRFRLPVEPYIIIIGSSGIFYFIRRFKAKIYPLSVLGGYFLLNLGIYFNSYQAKILVRTILEKANIW